MSRVRLTIAGLSVALLLGGLLLLPASAGKGGGGGGPAPGGSYTPSVSPSTITVACQPGATTGSAVGAPTATVTFGTDAAELLKTAKSFLVTWGLPGEANRVVIEFDGFSGSALAPAGVSARFPCSGTGTWTFTPKTGQHGTGSTAGTVTTVDVSYAAPSS